MDFDNPRLVELLRSPAEDLSFEIKEWLDLSLNLHRAKLAQAMIALANHGGGSILVGYAEQANGGFVEAEPRPSNLSGYTSDVVNEISRTYLNPPVHCDVRHIAHPVSGLTFPVISVPGGHSTPIMARRGGPQGQSSLHAGRIYIRRVGPASEEPQSPDEWRALLDRCIRAGRDVLIDQIRLIVAGEPLAARGPTTDEELDQWIEQSDARWQTLTRGFPPEHPARFPLGFYRFAYQVRGQFVQPSLTELRDALVAAEVKYSWPHWPVYSRDPIRPVPVNDTIECFLANDADSENAAPDSLDYWRVSVSGRAYTIRGLNEDSHPDLGKPGAGLDIAAPARRLADALTHASNLSRELGMQMGYIDFDLLWFGLTGRRLVAWGSRTRDVRQTRVTQQPQYRRRFSVSIDKLTEQLPEIVDAALRPMYETFDFFRLPAGLTASEITAWRSHN